MPPSARGASPAATVRFLACLFVCAVTGALATVAYSMRALHPVRAWQRHALGVVHVHTPSHRVHVQLVGDNDLALDAHDDGVAAAARKLRHWRLADAWWCYSIVEHLVRNNVNEHHQFFDNVTLFVHPLATSEQVADAVRTLHAATATVDYVPFRACAPPNASAMCAGSDAVAECQSVRCKSCLARYMGFDPPLWRTSHDRHQLALVPRRISYASRPLAVAVSRRAVLARSRAFWQQWLALLEPCRARADRSELAGDQRRALHDTVAYGDRCQSCYAAVRMWQWAFTGDW